jgi:hypothetical protein
VGGRIRWTSLSIRTGKVGDRLGDQLSKLVFDTRNCLDTVAFRKFGFRILNVGKGN